MHTRPRSTCQYTMIPGPRYRWCHSVIRFDDHDPNFLESEAHAVPSPHQAGSRIVRVLLTRRRIAARRLSRVKWEARTRRSAASVSTVAGSAADSPSATRLIPTLVPPEQNQQQPPVQHLLGQRLAAHHRGQLLGEPGAVVGVLE